MISSARVFSDGVERWSLSHDFGKGGVHHLEIAGELPPEMLGIVKQVRAEQTEADLEGEPLDVFMEAPIRAAEALCGYRHLEMDDLPAMTRLRPARTGLLAALFGGT